LRLEVDVDDPRFGQTVPCACKAREIEDKKMRALLERSNLQALQDKTFATFRPQEHQRNAYERAHEFAERPEGWCVLLGSFGTGKTHLAAAIGNRRLELGQPAIFMVVPDLLDHLRATFGPDSETAFDHLFESVRGAPLLILDDLGTQTTTAWATEKLFQILNHRYMMRLATVITTNARLDELGDRLASRMSDPELSICVSLAGPDWRAGRDSSASRGTAPSARSRSRQQGRT
jgi:DNA replication protein DnaC